ncbi:protein SOSEKI 1 [Hevea brasiliensis]|uniref:protein SOSEKI 1 n=1 Tax=Hevea brasiliensis TaxID=3981 RepID=UPI0025F60767|nr:protein SOSEKI 1 [Hevea brasiliensis]
MEASKTIPKGGGEVRRLHIIYFLSHMGRVEHPHLIRVHHLNRNGVHLRDVKRWMTDLRGKDMPEAFAWSYKRRYKNGYVWQDLLDDDLITPISDNEYVLKGSEIFPTTPLDTTVHGEKRASIFRNDKHVEVGIEDKQLEQEQSSTKETNQISPDTSIDISVKTSSEVYHESPIFSSERSTLSQDSLKQRDDSHEEEMDKFESLSSSSFYSSLLGKKEKKKKKKTNSNTSPRNEENIDRSSCSIEKAGTPSSSSSTQSQSQFAKSKSYSSEASKMLRNLMTCGAADANDAALVVINKSSSNKAEISKGGSSRGCGTLWNQQQPLNARMKDSRQQQKQHKSGFGKPKGVAAAYKPVAAPICSQCGKSFKPEKLHIHMKSCKGMKSSAKNAAASVSKTPSPSMNSMNQLMAVS